VASQRVQHDYWGTPLLSPWPSTAQGSLQASGTTCAQGGSATSHSSHTTTTVQTWPYGCSLEAAPDAVAAAAAAQLRAVAGGGGSDAASWDAIAAHSAGGGRGDVGMVGGFRDSSHNHGNHSSCHSNTLSTGQPWCHYPKGAVWVWPQTLQQVPLPPPLLASAVQVAQSSEGQQTQEVQLGHCLEYDQQQQQQQLQQQQTVDSLQRQLAAQQQTAWATVLTQRHPQQPSSAQHKARAGVAKGPYATLPHPKFLQIAASAGGGGAREGKGHEAGGASAGVVLDQSMLAAVSAAAVLPPANNAVGRTAGKGGRDARSIDVCV